MRPADYRTRPICNLALNPSFEASSGTVEVRRNHCPNPVPASATGYGGANGATVTFVASPYPAIEVVVPAGGFMDSGVTIANRAAWPVGEVWTVSFDLEAVTAGVYRTVYTGDGLPGIADSHTLAAGEKRRISLTATVATQAAGSIYIVRPADLNAYTFRVSRILIAVGVAGSYFDGGSSPDPDLTPAWTGAANASPAVLTGVGVASSGANYGTRQFQSSLWAASGGKSTRLINTVASGERMAFLAGDFSTLIVQPGRTYTALCKLRIDAPLTGVGSNSRRLLIRWGGAINGSVGSAQAPNVAGVHELRVTAAVPAGVSGVMIQANQEGNGNTWWDDLMIVEGVYDGPYRDGDSPGWAWLGAPGWSQSAGPGGL